MATTTSHTAGPSSLAGGEPDRPSPGGRRLGRRRLLGEMAAVVGAASAGVATGATLFGSKEGNPSSSPERSPENPLDAAARAEAARIGRECNTAENGRATAASIVRAAVLCEWEGTGNLVITRPVDLGPALNAPDGSARRWYGRAAYADIGPGVRAVSIIPVLGSSATLEGGTANPEAGFVDFNDMTRPLQSGVYDKEASMSPVGVAQVI